MRASKTERRTRKSLPRRSTLTKQPTEIKMSVDTVEKEEQEGTEGIQALYSESAGTATARAESENPSGTGVKAKRKRKSTLASSQSPQQQEFEPNSRKSTRRQSTRITAKVTREANGNEEALEEILAAGSAKPREIATADTSVAHSDVQLYSKDEDNGNLVIFSDFFDMSDVSSLLADEDDRVTVTEPPKARRKKVAAKASSAPFKLELDEEQIFIDKSKRLKLLDAELDQPPPKLPIDLIDKPRTRLPPRLDAFEFSSPVAQFLTSPNATEKRPRRVVPTVVQNLPQVIDDSHDEIINNDHCEVCNESGDLVCCESCPRSFHYCCAEPPLEPEDVEKIDHWYCNVCIGNKANDTAPAGIFKLLIQKMNTMNPNVFSLPNDIKTLFEGVSWDPATGDYIDTEETKIGRTSRSMPHLDNLESLGKKDYRPLFCFKCDQPLRNALSIACDFCPLHWHLDCLDPPLTAPPPASRRWKCPNHVDDLLPRRRRVPRKQRQIIELTDINARNDGDIDVEVEGLFPDVDVTLPKAIRRVSYRLPEEAIKLSFFHKVDATRKDAIELPHEASDDRIPSDLFETLFDSCINTYDAIDDSCNDDQTESMESYHFSDEEAFTWISSMSSFVESASRYLVAQRTSSFVYDILYRAAIGEVAPSKVAASSHTIPSDDPLFQQFLAWRRFMSLKRHTSRSKPK